MWRFDYEHNYNCQSCAITTTSYENGNRFYKLELNYVSFLLLLIELCLLFIILPIENCIPMTRNALSIEAVVWRANNVFLPHSIQAWDNDCWSNKVIEEQLDQRQIPPSKLEQYCMGCWPGLITV